MIITTAILSFDWKVAKTFSRSTLQIFTAVTEIGPGASVDLWNHLLQLPDLSDLILDFVPAFVEKRFLTNTYDTHQDRFWKNKPWDLLLSYKNTTSSICISLITCLTVAWTSRNKFGFSWSSQLPSYHLIGRSQKRFPDLRVKFSQLLQKLDREHQ